MSYGRCYATTEHGPKRHPRSFRQLDNNIEIPSARVQPDHRPRGAAHWCTVCRSVISEVVACTMFVSEAPDGSSMHARCRRVTAVVARHAMSTLSIRGTWRFPGCGDRRQG